MAPQLTATAGAWATSTVPPKEPGKESSAINFRELQPAPHFSFLNNNKQVAQHSHSRALRSESLEVSKLYAFLFTFPLLPDDNTKPQTN